MKKEHKTKWYEVVKWSFIYLMFVMIGVFLMFVMIGVFIGMTYQQMLIEKQVIDILGNTNLEINVNMNESKMVSELSNKFVPVFNSTIIRDFPKCCYPSDCPQAINNSKDCNCMYAIKCDFDLKI